MSKEKRRVPKLRFPGFTEDWEQRKLSEVTTCFDNLRVPVTASDRVPGKIPYYGANGIQDYVSGHTHSGEFVLIAEDGANDLNDYPIQYVNGAIWVNNHAHVIAGYKEKLENKFLSYSLKTVKMTTFIVGGGRSKLNLKALLEIPISMPNYDEQCVIGKFIETIDINITLHQRKLNNLKLKKKALLQKLFPKNGKRYPELRFPGFTDAWEQRKLGDVAIITGGGTPSTNVPEYWNGDIDWYSPVEIGKNRYVSKSTRKITKLGLEKSSAKLLPIGTVLFTSRAGIGNTAILQAEGCTNQGFQSITPDSKELDTYFLYTMTPRLKRYGEVTGAGSTFVEVSGKQMEKMSLVLPSLEEQKQIGRFFRTIDDSITLHQRKLDHLQLQKKALLQQMFV